MNRITINLKSIVRLLVSIASILIILSVLTQITAYKTGHHNMLGLVPFFNVDAELNLPTFFSGLILLFASFLLAIIYFFKRKEKDKYYWAVLSTGFLYLTFDEIFMFHERYVNRIMKKILGDHVSGIFQHEWLIWVIPFGIIAIVLFFMFFKFWYQLPSKTRMAFLASGIMYVGGSIGIELIEAFFYNILLNNLVSTVQETLEMFAVIFFIESLFIYISENFGEISFKLSD